MDVHFLYKGMAVFYVHYYLFYMYVYYLIYKNNFWYRELYDVKICPNKELATLKNITKLVLERNKCELPCSLHYYKVHHLPGKGYSVSKQHIACCSRLNDGFQISNSLQFQIKF